MTDDIIDSVIAEASTPVAQNTPNKAPEPEVNTTEADSQTEDNSEGDESEEVAFPKKAVNAISRRDKKIGKMQAELAALRAEKSQWTQPQAQPQANNQRQSNNDSQAPREEDFDNYGDYLKASAKHEIMAEIQAAQKMQNEGFQKQQSAAQREQYEAARTEVIVTQMQTHKESIPDFADVISESADIADDLPEAIANLFFEADDAALAFYNLAKEGKLEALATMTPTKAALEIAKAQLNKPQVKRISSAPNPISGASGRSSGGKSLDRMNGEELIKHLNIRY